jgi:hypothetical protein
MNYFAHGLRFVERPYFLAGTAVPDWLNVADRGVRMRARRVEPLLSGTGSRLAEVAAGVLQHIDDDSKFHRSGAFLEVSAQLARMFREALAPDDGVRPGFLGHIVSEMLLDAVLIDEHPGLLDAYYSAIARVDPESVEVAVNKMARNSTSRLAAFIPMFRREAFLRDYSDPARLLHRLNQVLRRVRLNPLPDESEEVLVAARRLVEPRVADLLPFSFTRIVAR